MKPPVIQITPPEDEKLKSIEVFAENPEEPSRKLYTDLVVSSDEAVSLPQHFNVRFLGKCPTDGLWGIEHTQKQVELIVGMARKSRRPSAHVTLHVAEEGLTLSASHNNRNLEFREGFVAIENVSYAVQDMVYTRIFALIVIHETDNTAINSPFECWAFACESSDVVHRLTGCVAEGFRRLAKLDRDDECRKPSIVLSRDSDSCHSDA